MKRIRESRCQRPGRGCTATELKEYNDFRKEKTYWRALPRLVTGVAL